MSLILSQSGPVSHPMKLVAFGGSPPSSNSFMSISGGTSRVPSFAMNSMTSCWRKEDEDDPCGRRSRCIDLLMAALAATAQRRVGLVREMGSGGGSGGGGWKVAGARHLWSISRHSPRLAASSGQRLTSRLNFSSDLSTLPGINNSLSGCTCIQNRIGCVFVLFYFHLLTQGISNR